MQVILKEVLYYFSPVAVGFHKHINCRSGRPMEARDDTVKITGEPTAFYGSTITPVILHNMDFSK